MKKSLLLVLLCVLFSTFVSVQASTYYTSTNGNNANPGTIEAPWKTLAFSVNKLKAGDILYVRGGIYNEVVNIYVSSGTANAPITISAFGTELPVIDGQGVLPTEEWDNLLSINVNYVNISGFEVRNTRLTTLTPNHDGGVVMVGHHCKVSKFNVHHCYYNGILIRGDYGIVEDSKVWQVNLENENGQNTQGWGSALSAARDKEDGLTDYATIRRNQVYNCWGEALSVYESQGSIIEDNIVYDNWQTNIYISDSRNTLFQRNIVYNTPNNTVGKQGGGLWMADEVAAVPRSDNNMLINNCFLNVEISLFSWSLVPESGLTNALFANNTAINTKLSTGNVNTNSQIANNIFYSAVHSVPSKTGITFSNNFWKATPPVNAAGSDDLKGNPQITHTGSVAAGALTGEYFKLAETSPAINKGMVLANVTTDFFKVNRDITPDMGAYEYPNTVGINKLNTPSFRIYPNPAINYLTIDLPDFQGNEKMQIINILGLITKEIDLKSAVQQISIEDLLNGIYFVRLNHDPNLSIKIIKQ